MATIGARFKSGPQDMPPPGGYDPIQTSRVHLRRIVTPTIASALTIASAVIGGIAFYYSTRDFRRSQIEMQSARHVLLPLLIAERDREFLKNLRRNYNEEKELMKDYPGWVVGTYFGEPVYHGEPEDKLIEPCYKEYTVHASFEDTQELYFRSVLT